MIKELVKEVIDVVQLFEMASQKKHFSKIKYLSTDGSTMPNGIEINGLSSEGLLRLAEMIARIFHQETVLVKDFNNMKIYLANGLRSNDNPDFSQVNSKVMMKY